MKTNYPYVFDNAEVKQELDRLHDQYVLVPADKAMTANDCPSVCLCYNITADCSNQNLSYIPRLPKGIQRINLSGNFYQHITRQTFENVSKEHEVDYLDLSICNILEEMSLSSNTLQELHIGNIGAKYPPTFDSNRVFNHTPELVKLKMARFDLMNTNMSLLLGFLLKLEELVIYDCRLLQIPDIISKLNRLKVLDLGTNFIGAFHFHLFKDLKDLKNLTLRANRISVIDNNSISIASLDRLSLLDIRFNPYACNCDLYWFINSVLKERKSILFQNDLSSYQCSSPINLYNRTLMDYNPSYYECHSLTTQEAIAIAAVCIFILLIILVVLYKKYKWHIKYYAYLLRSRKGYEKIEGTDESDILFDAFVAYNEDDRSWVISNLMSELEGKEQYRLCLHERDFLPGRTIFSQISHTIQRSRKVILVISDSFAKSQWCQYETLVAQDRLIDDGANVLIVVLLGEIQSKYMTDSLHMLLRSMTYIRWPPANSLGRELFWNRIRLAMKQ
ncbi:toll-like receptor 2 type-2 [Saccostrea echinata]|uniref:toll-like receptor 2 type-2 n=1 Tax=Saccostrea echinata TaxID=191078 RepID=UPI002A80B933|nr:toll-like receptor 2 type-2 [Saccostrea echinata]